VRAAGAATGRGVGSGYKKESAGALLCAALFGDAERDFGSGAFGIGVSGVLGLYVGLGRGATGVPSAPSNY